MNDQTNLAVGHFPGHIGRHEDNLAFVDRLAKSAAAEGGEFLLLPEDCLTGYPAEPGSAAGVAIAAEGREIKRLSDIAHVHRIAIAAGLIEAAPNKRFN